MLYSFISVGIQNLFEIVAMSEYIFECRHRYINYMIWVTRELTQIRFYYCISLAKYLKLNKFNQHCSLIGYKTQDYVYVHMLEQVYVDLLITNH